MKTRHHTKLVREGNYVAEVEVELIETDEGWSPYLSLEGAEKLDAVRKALRQGEIEKACQMGHVFRLMPIAVLREFLWAAVYRRKRPRSHRLRQTLAPREKRD